MKGAPKGNEFWKQRSKHGRDKIFETPELMWEAACEYFQWCEENPLEENDFVGKDATEVDRKKLRPFTLQGICLYLDVNRGIKGKEDDVSKDFSFIITRIKEIIYNQKFTGAAVGFFNSNIIARDLGLSDKKDLNVKGVGKDFIEETYE
jgi:hypothetical protein